MGPFPLIRGLFVGALITASVFVAVAPLQMMGQVTQLHVGDREVFSNLVCALAYNNASGGYDSLRTDSIKADRIKEYTFKGEIKRATYFHEKVSDLANTGALVRDGLVQRGLLSTKGVMTAGKCAEWLHGTGLDLFLKRDDVRAAIKEWRKILSTNEGRYDWSEHLYEKCLSVTTPLLRNDIQAWVRQHLRFCDHASINTTLDSVYRIDTDTTLYEIIAFSFLVRVSSLAMNSETTARIESSTMESLHWVQNDRWYTSLKIRLGSNYYVYRNMWEHISDNNIVFH
jgi:hypothetical protein